MLSSWLRREGRASCTVFCTGWAMDPNPFRGLVWPDGDLLLLYAYRDLVSPSFQLLDDYQEIHLIAWSMGVFIAAALLANASLPSPASAIAIGGTLYPLDSQRGIPESLFEAMSEQCDSAALHRFHRSMFDDDVDYQRFIRQNPRRSCDDVCAELAGLACLCRSGHHVQDMFTCCIVPFRDRVFSARNQIRAWGKSRCRTVQAPHFPFYQWGGLLPPGFPS